MRAYSQYIGLALGLLATVPCAVVAIAAAGGGHGSYFPAKLLFPFSMLSTLFSHPISSGFVLVALLQFPAYGFVLGYCHKAGCFKRGLFALASAHALALILILVFPNSNFPNRFGFANKAHSLGGAERVCLHFVHHRGAASDARRWA